MLDMIESIARIGVLSPAIIRPKSDGRYEMIAGHRRKHACFKNGMDTIPCQIKELNDDEATIIMVDTNLRQRQNILPSEKAFAYWMLLDAMTRQGYRSDLTSGPVGKSQNHNNLMFQLRTQWDRGLELMLNCRKKCKKVRRKSKDIFD